MRLQTFLVLCTLAAFCLLAFTPSSSDALSRRKMMKMKKLGALALLLKLKGKRKMVFALPIPIPFPMSLLDALKEKKGKKEDFHIGFGVGHHHHHASLVAPYAVTPAPLIQHTYQPMPYPMPIPNPVYLEPLHAAPIQIPNQFVQMDQQTFETTPIKSSSDSQRRLSTKY